MSLTCHLFSLNIYETHFRATVEHKMVKLHSVHREALPLRADLSIAGAHCAFATNSEDVFSAVEPWRCSPLAASSRTFEMDVLLDASLSCERDVKTQTHFRGLHHLVFATIGDHEVFTFDLLRKRVVAAVSEASAVDRDLWNAHWLPITVGVMGTTVGVVPLHSACLSRNGKGLLIAGTSGAGKSTLSVALARRDFSHISDDWTYISRDAGSGHLVAHGFNAPIKLLPDAVRHFPEFGVRTPKMWFNGELAFEIEHEAICPDDRTLTTRPHWLIFLERSASPGCDFSPCTSAVANEFFESSAERLPDQLPEASAMRSDMIRAVSNCACWRLRTGESPQVTAEAISRFCEAN
jgi:hypothetical protein